MIPFWDPSFRVDSKSSEFKVIFVSRSLATPRCSTRFRNSIQVFGILEDLLKLFTELFKFRKGISGGIRWDFFTILCYWRSLVDS